MITEWLERVANATDEDAEHVAEIVSQRVVYDSRLGEVGGQPVITAESLGA